MVRVLLDSRHFGGGDGVSFTPPPFLAWEPHQAALTWHQTVESALVLLIGEIRDHLCCPCPGPRAGFWPCPLPECLALQLFSPECLWHHLQLDYSLPGGHEALHCLLISMFAIWSVQFPKTFTVSCAKDLQVLSVHWGKKRQKISGLEKHSLPRKPPIPEQLSASLWSPLALDSGQP